MIHDLIVGKFISIMKKEQTPEELIKKSKDRVDKWYQNKMRDWTRVISVEENKEDILQSVIKIETWDTTQFSPAHSEAYKNMTIQATKLKNNMKEGINIGC